MSALSPCLADLVVLSDNPYLDRPDNLYVNQKMLEDPRKF